MPQTSDELLKWTVAELPALKCRLAKTYAAIEQARMLLRDAPRAECVPGGC
jgi:hypothetical protein